MKTNECLIVVLMTMALLFETAPLYAQDRDKDCGEQFLSLSNNFCGLEAKYLQEYLDYGGKSAQAYLDSDRQKYEELRGLEVEARKKADYFGELCRAAREGRMPISCAELQSLIASEPSLKLLAKGKADLQGLLNDLDATDSKVRILTIQTDGDKIVISTEKVLSYSKVDGEITTPYKELELSKNEYDDFISNSLTYHYVYDPLTDKFVSAFEGPGQKEFALTPEMIHNTAPEIYASMLEKSADEAWHVVEQASQIATSIENQGVKTKWQEQLEEEMRWTDAASAGSIGALQTIATYVLPIPEWINNLSDVNDISSLPKDVAEAAEVISQSVSQGWVPNAGSELLEAFGGKDGIEYWLLHDPYGNQALFEYSGWKPEQHLEYNPGDFDRTNYTPTQGPTLNKGEDILSQYDKDAQARMQESASKLAPLMADQIIQWDRCNLNMERAKRIELEIYHLEHPSKHDTR
jgi:hypothetical protein